MMRNLFLMTLLTVVISSGLHAQNLPIYNFKIDSITGSGKIDFDKFRGKKILIVNASSADSNFTQQYRELTQLCQIYKDKLVIVVVPSNSFNTETGTDQQVASRYAQSLIYKFPVSKRLNVTNPQIHLLFKWLTKQSDNGVTDSEIKKPFYKYLISKDGKLISSFNQKISPMHPLLRSVIEKETN